jgi:2-polyprenyl-3-methyl-5-hydroxy-6-metoxy-1,4-benzoquinol methylase
MDPEHYYLALAAAYSRGVRPELAAIIDDAAAVEAARAQGLRLHRFKRTATLPRVRRVLGVLKGYRPATLLDAGSGRGAFLWPALDEMREVATTAIDVLPHRVAVIAAVARGGVTGLRCARMDMRQLGFADRTFEVVTALEVLEHLPDPERAAAELVRVACRAVVVTVPSRADDNPEHVQLFDQASLQALFVDAGAARVEVEFVFNHLVAVVTP